MRLPNPGTLRTVAAAYGLDPDAIQPVASHYRSAAAFRAGRVLLKPYRYPERQLRHALKALEHLGRKNFALTPALVRTSAGAGCLRAGGIWWYATTWLDGRPPRLPAELPAAARSLAAFHLAAQGCRIRWSSSRSWIRRYHGVVLDVATFARAAEAGTTPFDRAYARAAPGFQAQAIEALAQLTASDYLRLEHAVRQGTGFCHRDFTAANLLVDRTGQVCLIDPDTWGADLRLHDLVRLIHTGTGADPAAALTALRVYERDLPLNPAERHLLPVALSLPRTFWWAGVCRYRRTAPGPSPDQLLADALAGAPDWDACVRELRRALWGERR